MQISCLQQNAANVEIFPSQYATYVYRFIPRDAMRKRGLCCRPVSVCSSVTLVYSIHTAEDFVKLLSPPGSPITVVFLIPGADTQSNGIAWNTLGYCLLCLCLCPLQWGRKIHGVGKICGFRPKSPFISETVRDRLTVAIERI